MKTLESTILLAVILFVPLVVVSQKNTTNAGPLLRGSNVAVTQTESGKVRGYVHNGVFTYKGIPYAKAERFLPPAKPDSWEGVRSSLTYGPVCPLIDPTNSVMDEVEFVFHHDGGCTTETGATMLSDNPCVEKYHHDKDLMAIVPQRAF